MYHGQCGKIRFNTLLGFTRFRLLDYRVILIKILKEEFVKDFLDGNIYMNSDRFFTEIDEKDLVRFDKDEGADKSWQVKSISIANEQGKWVPIGGIINPVIYRHSNKNPINILCLYAYSDRKNDNFNKLNLDFGCTAIIIKDLNEFIRRLKESAKNKGKNIWHGPVTYFDRETYHGNMGPFSKFSNYEYQNEFQFIATNGSSDPITLEIGDIRDIVMVAPSNTISKIPRIKT